MRLVWSGAKNASRGPPTVWCSDAPFGSPESKDVVASDMRPVAVACARSVPKFASRPVASNSATARSVPRALTA
eukprot:3804802-Rhodomonas_salina.2